MPGKYERNGLQKVSRLASSLPVLLSRNRQQHVPELEGFYSPHSNLTSSKGLCSRWRGFLPSTELPSHPARQSIQAQGNKQRTNRSCFLRTQIWTLPLFFNWNTTKFCWPFGGQMCKKSKATNILWKERHFVLSWRCCEKKIVWSMRKQKHFYKVSSNYSQFQLVVFFKNRS